LLVGARTSTPSAGRSRAARNGVTAALAASALLCTAALLVGLDRAPLSRVDERLASGVVTRFVEPAAVEAADQVTHLADARRSLVLAAGVIALGLSLRRFREALGAAILLAGANGTTQLLQTVAPSEPRVLAGGVVVEGPFPSGHSTAAVGIAAALVLVLPSRLRPFGAAAGCVFVAVEWLAVMIVHTHMPSHLLGGLLVAVAWAALALLATGAVDGGVAPGSRRSTTGPQRLHLLLPIGVVAATAAGVLLPDRGDVRELFSAHGDVATPAALAVGALTLALASIFYAASRELRKRQSATPT
jgi:membrane-associated phospholipid phosphatase